MRTFLILLSLLLAVAAMGQDSVQSWKKPFIVKSNVFSLIAKRPTLSLEKVFTPTFSTELSFVWGEFNHVLFTDHYRYHGFLLRAKKHFVPFAPGRASFYAGAYGGNLKRTIYTQGRTDASGWFGYPDRYFTANSLRGGISLGLSQIKSSRLVLDFQSSLGYGRYLNLDKDNPDTYSNGYLDAQLWFSLGYCF